jgi:maltose/moltooligosaccharide transporter
LGWNYLWSLQPSFCNSFAFALPYIAKQIGRRKTHALSLVLGGIGLISMYFMPNKEALIFSMILVGFAWASILAMPYAILAGSIHPKKMGVYMGILTFFIVIPQISKCLNWRTISKICLW